MAGSVSADIAGTGSTFAEGDGSQSSCEHFAEIEAGHVRS